MTDSPKPLALQTSSADNDWRWKNSAGTQGFIHVNDQGVIELMVDDGYYSGWLSLEDSVAVARTVYASSIAAMTPRPAEEVAMARDIIDAVGRAVPIEYRVYLADPARGYWSLDDAALLRRRYLLRDLVLVGARRFEMDAVSTASVLLELSAALIVRDGKLSEADFIENARQWFIAAGLASPDTRVNTPGGSS